MNFVLLLLLQLRIEADCAERHNPSWLPTGHGLDGFASKLQAPQSHLGLLCCGGVWGGVPSLNSAIRAWQELDGRAVPLVSMEMSSKIKCSTEFAPLVSSKKQIYANRPECTATKDFPAVFDVKQCSMGINQETSTFEFAKCCAGAFGLVGDSMRHDPVTKKIFRFFNSEEQCKAAICPAIIKRCEFPETVYDEDSDTCLEFTKKAQWIIKKGFSCQWSDDQFQIASYSNPSKCLEDCYNDENCKGAELTLSSPPLCITRVQNCKNARRTRTPKVTMIKRTEALLNRSDSTMNSPSLSYEFYFLVLCLCFLFVVSIFLTYRKKKQN